jgi:hypothetical protein
MPTVESSTPQFKSPTPNISARTEPRKPPQTQQPVPPSLDQDAFDFAKKGFLEPWTQVGDSWFTWWRYTESGKTVSLFIQIKGVTYKVKPERLSEAETLNGLEWRGRVDFFSRVYRIYDQFPLGQQVPQWGDWRDGQAEIIEYRLYLQSPVFVLLPVYFLTKKDGRWAIDKIVKGDKEHLTKPSEKQINKILPQ